jgi:hypothetical protein
MGAAESLTCCEAKEHYSWISRDEEEKVSSAETPSNGSVELNMAAEPTMAAAVDSPIHGSGSPQGGADVHERSLKKKVTWSQTDLETISHF